MKTNIFKRMKAAMNKNNYWQMVNVFAQDGLIQLEASLPSSAIRMTHQTDTDLQINAASIGKRHLSEVDWFMEVDDQSMSVHPEVENEIFLNFVKDVTVKFTDAEWIKQAMLDLSRADTDIVERRNSVELLLNENSLTLACINGYYGIRIEAEQAIHKAIEPTSVLIRLADLKWAATALRYFNKNEIAIFEMSISSGFVRFDIASKNDQKTLTMWIERQTTGYDSAIKNWGVISDSNLSEIKIDFDTDTLAYLAEGTDKNGDGDKVMKLQVAFNSSQAIHQLFLLEAELEQEYDQVAKLAIDAKYVTLCCKLGCNSVLLREYKGIPVTSDENSRFEGGWINMPPIHQRVEASILTQVIAMPMSIPKKRPTP